MCVASLGRVNHDRGVCTAACCLTFYACFWENNLSTWAVFHLPKKGAAYFHDSYIIFERGGKNLKLFRVFGVLMAALGRVVASNG